jgi:glycosyltransferase involved in cell wall biosynthesis
MSAIALITPRYAPAVGGVERHVEALALGLVGLGLEVEVITTDPTGRLPAVEQRAGVLVRRFPTIARDAVFFLSPGLGAWLARNARRFQLLHAHLYHTPLALQAAISARAMGLPLVLTPHYHGTGHSRFRRLLHPPYRPIGRWMLRYARRIFCVSQAEQRLLAQHFGEGLPSLVVPNGVEVEELAGARPLGAHSDRRRILAVGRLERYKQTDMLLRALPSLPDDYEAVVIGDGPLRATIQDTAERLGLRHRLRLLRHLPRRELVAWYRSADAFVSLSRHESFGITALEAAAAGTPVLLSDIPAHREVAGYLPDGRAAFVRVGCGTAELGRAIEQTVGLGRIADTSTWQLPTWAALARRAADEYQAILGRAADAGGA